MAFFFSRTLNVSDRVFFGNVWSTKLQTNRSAMWNDIHYKKKKKPTCQRCCHVHCRTTSCWCCNTPHKQDHGCHSNYRKKQYLFSQMTLPPPPPIFLFLYIVHYLNVCFPYISVIIHPYVRLHSVCTFFYAEAQVKFLAWVIKLFLVSGFICSVTKAAFTLWALMSYSHTVFGHRF